MISNDMTQNNKNINKEIIINRLITNIRERQLAYILFDGDS